MQQRQLLKGLLLKVLALLAWAAGTVLTLSLLSGSALHLEFARMKGHVQITARDPVPFPCEDFACRLRHDDWVSVIALVLTCVLTQTQPAHDVDIDAWFEGQWKKRDLKPAPPCDDAVFLRRVSLDLIGMVPSPDEVRSFIKSSKKDKRARKIDDLGNDCHRARASWGPPKFRHWCGRTGARQPACANRAWGTFHCGSL